MKVTIHRGINQIGGCITEIATDEARILIDLGHNLPEGDLVAYDELANTESITKLTEGCDAILYTHTHGDHIDLYSYVPSRIKQYVGKTAREVMLCKNNRLNKLSEKTGVTKEMLAKIKNMIPYEEKQRLHFGDITVTPYFVSHSIYDSYMFLIEAQGKRILHTGDFREHSYLGKGLVPTIQKLILSKGPIDLLITEGTMVSRREENVSTEHELQKEIIRQMRHYKYLFVLCSSTDLERLSTIRAAANSFKERPFITDKYQASILDIYTRSAGEKSPLFRFDPLNYYEPRSKKFITLMQDKGFVMLVRSGEYYRDQICQLLSQLDSKDTLLIYSMWPNYINEGSIHKKQETIDFVHLFPNLKIVETTGHASPETLAKVANLVNPTMGIIPIHCECSSEFCELNISEELKRKIITESVTRGGIVVVVEKGNKINKDTIHSKKQIL
ncbi:MAG TPA: MBL fold metallo-hydrolase [Bacteroidales bacterium]